MAVGAGVSAGLGVLEGFCVSAGLGVLDGFGVVFSGSGVGVGVGSTAGRASGE